MVVSINGDTPLSLDGYCEAKSIYKWMITGGTPIYGNTHITIIWYLMDVYGDLIGIDGIQCDLLEYTFW